MMNGTTNTDVRQQSEQQFVDGHSNINNKHMLPSDPRPTSSNIIKGVKELAKSPVRMAVRLLSPQERSKEREDNKLRDSEIEFLDHFLVETSQPGRSSESARNNTLAELDEVLYG